MTELCAGCRSLTELETFVKCRRLRVKRWSGRVRDHAGRHGGVFRGLRATRRDGAEASRPQGLLGELGAELMLAERDGDQQL